MGENDIRRIHWTTVLQNVVSGLIVAVILGGLSKLDDFNALVENVQELENQQNVLKCLTSIQGNAGITKICFAPKEQVLDLLYGQASGGVQERESFREPASQNGLPDDLDVELSTEETAILRSIWPLPAPVDEQ